MSLSVVPPLRSDAQPRHGWLEIPSPGYLAKIRLALTDTLVRRTETLYTLTAAAIAFGCLEIAQDVVAPGTDASLWYHVRVAASAALFALVAKGLNVFHLERRFVARYFYSGLCLACLLSVAPAALLIGSRVASMGIPGAILFLGIFQLLAYLHVRSHPKRFVIVGPETPTTREMREHGTVKPGSNRFVLHRWVDWDAFVNGEPASDLVISKEALSEPWIASIMLHAGRRACNVVDEATYYGDIFGRIPVQGKASEWTLLLGLRSRTPASDQLVRLFEITVSAIGLVLVSPLLLLLGIAVKLESRGPVFFFHERQGRHLRSFRMIKFRTMTHNTAAPHVTFTVARDPRVTRVGRVLRHFHLDELPQLVNIIRGDMSLVGPRPEMLQFARGIGGQLPLYDLRYAVRPGLTGWAQINQGYALDDLDATLTKLTYDFYYLKHRSFAFDLSIIIRTLFFVWNDTHYQKIVRPK